MAEGFQDSQFLLEQAISLARLDEKTISQEAKIQALERQLKALQEERDKALRWGLFLLGSSLLSLAGWVFKFITGGGVKL